VIDAASEDFQLILLFAASTGARAGEQWAARWGDVGFVRHELRISRRVDAYGEEGAPKSIAGVRTIPLSARLVAMLKEWKLKSQFSKNDDLIFPNRKGRHLSHDNLIKRRFRPLFGKLPTIKQFNWHGLRHFAVSCWIEAGLAPKTVQTFADMLPCRSRWIATGTYFQATITAVRWTRSPRDCSHDWAPLSHSAPTSSDVYGHYQGLVGASRRG